MSIEHQAFHSIQSSDVSIRLNAVHDLASLQNERAGAALRHALHDPDLRVRMAIRYALAQRQDTLSVPLFLADLQATQGAEQAALVDALGIMQDARAVGPLCEMLPLSPATIQRAIVIALGGLRDPIALDPLLVLLPKTRDTLRCQIVTALSQLEQPSAITAMVKAFRAHVRNSDEHEAHNFCQMCASMQSALISMGPAIIDPILALLKHPHGYDALFINVLRAFPEPHVCQQFLRWVQQPNLHTTFRCAAIDGLDQCATEEVVTVLETVLTNREEDSDIHVECLYTLGTIAEMRGTPHNAPELALLTAYLGDTQRPTTIRQTVAFILGAMRATETSDTLYEQMLAEPAMILRTAYALAQLGDVRAYEPLITLVLHPNESIDHKKEALTALGLLGDSRAIPLMTMIVQDSNATALYDSAQDALHRLSEAST